LASLPAFTLVAVLGNFSFSPVVFAISDFAFLSAFASFSDFAFFFGWVNFFDESAFLAAFFWLGILGVSLRSLGDSRVPRQFLLPHQQGYSALSFLV
jgi:hypothetical protein